MILSRALILAAGSIPLVATVAIAFFWQAPTPLPLREEAFAPCPTGSAQLIDLPVPEILAGDGAPAFSLTDTIPAEFAAAVPVSETFALTFDRFRAPLSTLRRSDSEAFHDKRVRLTLIVGTSGDLLFAMPTAGPKELFEDALRVVRGMTIKPILRDGKPILARIENFQLAVGLPERRPAKPDPLPAIADWQSLRIGYSENWIGIEKRFQLEIRGDGTVTYLGRSNVALLGRHCARISRTSVERLVGAFRTAEFLRLDEKYRAGVSHGPLIHTSIAFDGVGKTVEVFRGEARTCLTSWSSCNSLPWRSLAGEGGRTAMPERWWRCEPKVGTSNDRAPPTRP